MRDSENFGMVQRDWRWSSFSPDLWLAEPLQSCFSAFQPRERALLQERTLWGGFSPVRNCREVFCALFQLWFLAPAFAFQRTAQLSNASVINEKSPANSCLSLNSWILRFQIIEDGCFGSTETELEQSWWIPTAFRKELRSWAESKKIQTPGCYTRSKIQPRYSQSAHCSTAEVLNLCGVAQTATVWKVHFRPCSTFRFHLNSWTFCCPRKGLLCWTMSGILGMAWRSHLSWAFIWYKRLPQLTVHNI